MPRLIHLNGPPGIGKSTLSALYADRHPGTLNLDVDTLHHLIGAWQDEQTDTWPAVWSLVRTMAATHLGGGAMSSCPSISRSVAGTVQETYDLLAYVLGEPVSP
jgi:hypothetical protein